MTNLKKETIAEKLLGSSSSLTSSVAKQTHLSISFIAVGEHECPLPNTHTTGKDMAYVFTTSFPHRLPKLKIRGVCDSLCI